MRMDRMTTKAQEAIRSALDLASRRGNPELLPEHIIIAALEQDEGIAQPLIQKAGARPNELTAELRKRLESLPRVTGGAEPQLSRRGLALIQKSEDEARALKDDYLSVEHLLLAAAKSDSELKPIFARFHLGYDKLLEAMASVRGSHRVTDQEPERKFQALEKYTRDLTEQARRSKLDSVIGRDEEIRRVMQVLSRRTKNN
ncbi:MAG TPA: Clp protease N-terminal domain-containing protein, partial [Polyangiaceae bacterium]|nr:Clp protease N-terminal domain-containing protein [Polyangiaceae bacterium]